MSREKLITYIWPDVDSERGRHLLADSVYRINKALGDDTITAVGDELRLNRQCLACDVVEFEEALDQTRYSDAVALYDGSFLDGFFLDGAPEFAHWADRERERLSRLFATALESLAEESEQRGELRRAMGWWQKLAAHDPFSARIALRLMQALDAAGERAAALQHARTHTLLLREEFGTEPDPEVVALAERLKSEPVASGRAVEGVEERRSEDGTDAAAFELVTPHRPEPALRKRQKLTIRRTALLVAICLLLTTGVWLLWPHPPDSPSGAPPIPTTIAVLPFTDRSAERDQAYFGDGITEELITTLSQVDGLRVASSRSVFAYRNSSEDVRSIGTKLGVASVLEGSVRSQGNRLRITAQLVNVADGYQLWAQTYDRPAGDAFVIQQDIAQAIAQILRVRLARGAGGASGRAPPDPQAYQLYLQGRSVAVKMSFNRLATTPEGYLAPIRLYEQAVARDSTFAEPYAEMASSLLSLGFLENMAPGEAFPRAEAAASKAVALDPTLGGAHTSLAYVELYYRWNLAGAEEAFRRAIELSPGDRIAHQWYANMLTAAGRFPEAVREMKRAQAADPLALMAIAAEGWVHYHARDYPAALDAYRRVLVLNPDLSLAHLWRAWALEEMDSLPAALEAHRRAVVLSDSGAVMVAALARAHARAGDRRGAEALLRRLEARSASGGHIPPYDIAKIHDALGRRDEAFDWLERARRQRSRSMALLRVDPQLDPLRADPRFTRMVEQVFAAESGS